MLASIVAQLMPLGGDFLPDLNAATGGGLQKKNKKSQALKLIIDHHCIASCFTKVKGILLLMTRCDRV